MAEVVSVHTVRKKKALAESHESVCVRKNYGIQGDYRSGKYLAGQMTLVEAEVMDNVSNKLGYEVPAGASRRQIMVKGISLNELLGQRLRLGPVIVEVTDLCKPCDNMETAIGPGAKDAMNGRGGVRCRVITGGELRIGDTVAIINSYCPHFARLTRLKFKFINYLIRLAKKL